MKGKETKIKAKKPAKTSRRSSIRKSIKKPKLDKVIVEVPILQDDPIKNLVFETPNKGFRPYEAPNSDLGTPLDSVQDSGIKFKLSDKIPSPGKRAKNEQPDIWTAGIENVPFFSDEFDFPSFPIQY